MQKFQLTLVQKKRSFMKDYYEQTFFPLYIKTTNFSVHLLKYISSVKIIQKPSCNSIPLHKYMFLVYPQFNVIFKLKSRRFFHYYYSLFCLLSIYKLFNNKENIENLLILLYFPTYTRGRRSFRSKRRKK